MDVEQGLKDGNRLTEAKYAISFDIILSFI